MLLGSTNVQSWLVGSTILKYVLANKDPNSIVTQKRRTQKSTEFSMMGIFERKINDFSIKGRPLKDV